LAAFANIWSKDKMLAYKTNVTGTTNILEAALQNKVKKVVFTSSAAILPTSLNGEEVDETFPLPGNFLTEYETTKVQAEQLCTDYCQKGLDVVIVNPSRVFGPGLLNKSNSVTILIKKYIDGKWRIIPGNGEAVGNYVFIDDVVNGHILAMQKGVPGEKYIIGGTNISFNDFFKGLSMVSGKNYKLFHLPFSIMLATSKFELFMADTFGKNPLITPPWAKRYLQNRPVSSQKAIEQLNYTITPLSEGISKTIEWLNKYQYEK
jgi:nucleoside-diphosphate-sugar epimerase